MIANPDAERIDLAARVACRPLAIREPRIRFRLGPGDAPLVDEGDRLEVDAPLFERLRHPTVAEASLHGAAAPVPGHRFEAGQPLAGQGRSAVRLDAGGRVLYATPQRRVRAVVARHHDPVLAPLAGTVEEVSPHRIVMRADGTALPAALAYGEPAHGPLLFAVDAPDAELRSNRIDVRGAGAILVAGSRADSEAITRARAMGVRGMIVGGIVRRDIREMEASHARQEAALHAAPPFALVVLDGFGKRPIPESLWDNLVAAAGSDVALSIDPPGIVVDAGQAVASGDPDRIRVTAGEALGRTGRIVGLVGPRRRAAGIVQDCAIVALDPGRSGEPADRIEVALADLERDG